MYVGNTYGILVVKVWNRTESDIQNIKITFSNNLLERQRTIKKIKKIQ